MNKITAFCLLITLTGVITSNAIFARGGGGGHGGGGFGGGGFGGGHGEGGGGGGHFGNGGHGGGWGHGGGDHDGGGGGHGGGGIGFGFYGLGYGPGYYGGYGPYYGGYGGYYGYPPTVVTVPTSPPVYIQQAPPVAQQYHPGFWYYCSNPQGYYPYVKACLNRWQQVPPTPLVHP